MSNSSKDGRQVIIIVYKDNNLLKLVILDAPKNYYLSFSYILVLCLTLTSLLRIHSRLQNFGTKAWLLL